MRYQPRQWRTGLVATDVTHGTITVTNAGIGQGCDFHPGYNNGFGRIQTSAQMHEFLLNRPSRVYIIGREPANKLPSWMTALPQVGTVSVSVPRYGSSATWPVFRADIPAGTTYFGAAWSVGSTPTEPRNMPWFVFCEADGSPTLAPPGNIAPNTQCPASLHDRFVTADGYRTWHPEIDPVYWCYYGHEHGTNPAWLDDDPPRFNELDATEGHAGFKVYVMTTTDGLYRVRIIHHFGTGSLARVCTRFHTFEIRVRRISDNALMADLKFMADYGPAVENDTGAALTPNACPNQAADAIADGSTGVRQIPVEAGGFTGYEPWRGGPHNRSFLVQSGIWRGSITPNTPDGILHCLDDACNTAVTTTTSGTERFLTDDVSFRIQHVGTMPDTFCTDVMGMAVISCTQAGAVQQFVASGFSMSNNLIGECVDVRAWGYPYQCATQRIGPAERENSIPAGAGN